MIRRWDLWGGQTTDTVWLHVDGLMLYGQRTTHDDRTVSWGID